METAEETPEEPRANRNESRGGQEEGIMGKATQHCATAAPLPTPLCKHFNIYGLLFLGKVISMVISLISLF